jgi:hypothetical protein
VEARRIWSHLLLSGSLERLPDLLRAQRTKGRTALILSTMRLCSLAEYIARPLRTSGKVGMSMRQAQNFSVSCQGSPRGQTKQRSLDSSIREDARALVATAGSLNQAAGPVKGGI